MEPIDIVNAAVAGDKNSFMAAFNAALSNKVSDALDVKKVEIASNLLGTQEEVPNEVQTDTVEVDGSSDASAATNAE
ncbi:MAG: hypothetical protein EBU08_16965 [Micrococcales bacterium]|nr:hypothetical protein [Micrococcales bacterium]